MRQFLLFVFAIVGLSSCAHHNDVRPGAEGVHKVIVQGENTEEGSRNAIKQANHFCKEQGKYAAFVEEKNAYTGDLDEKTYKNVKMASKVATAAGGAAHVFGGRRESRAGGVVGLGGVITDQAIGNGYTVEMKFACK